MSKAAVIEAINGKIDRLVEDNRRLRDEYSSLSLQRDKLKSENRALTEQIARLEKRVGVLELRDGLSGGGENTKLAKARVNRLMREVDKCIALLNK